MAVEFPSRMIAVGFVNGTGVPFNDRSKGAVVTRNGVGDYTITTDRPIANGWASIQTTIAVTRADWFTVQSGQNQFLARDFSGQPVDTNFHYVIFAVDESK